MTKKEAIYLLDLFLNKKLGTEWNLGVSTQNTQAEELLFLLEERLGFILPQWEDFDGSVNNTWEK